MSLRFPKETDVCISLEAEKKSPCPEADRKIIAARLFKLVMNKNLINVRRSLVFCPICRNVCTYTPEGEQNPRNFSKSSILDQRNGFDITVPIQFIHILAEHPEVDIDENIIKYFS